MTAFCNFSGDALKKNLIEQLLRGLQNENIQNKLNTQVDDLNFERAVEKAAALHDAEIDISELKYKHTNVNKVACTKSVHSKKFLNSSQNRISTDM